MFYSQCLLSKKGPLGAIWVAAYFFKKLKKAQVKDTDIPSSVDEILQSELDAVAYRVLAYLLLGVVRIYSKKVDYLYHDCNKVLVGIKEFVVREKNRAAKEIASASYFTIALPERFELDAFDLQIIEDVYGGHVRPQEDITLKDGGWKNEGMGQYLMEKFDHEDLAPFYEICSADHDRTEGVPSSHEMDIDTEEVRNRQEENANSETCCVVEEEAPDSNKSSTDHQNTHEPMEDSGSDKTPEEASREKIRDDGFHPEEFLSPDKICGVEREPLSSLQTGREEINISDKDEAANEMPHIMEDTSSLQASTEKPQENSEGQRMDFKMFHGAQEVSFELARSDCEEHQNGSEKTSPHNTTLSRTGKFQVNTEGTPVSVTPEVPPRLEIPEPTDAGATTPQIVLLPTPAVKEGARVSRKRKCLIDDRVVLSNSFIKRCIEDSSQLITKRRKAPHNVLAAWRSCRLSSLSSCFLDSLIQYTSLDLRLLLLEKKKPKVSDPDDKPAEPPRTPKMTETPEAAKGFEKTDLAPETPVREPTSIRCLKSPATPTDKEARRMNSFESCGEETPCPSKDQELYITVMHEMTTNENEDPQQDGWSGRTRAVARYLNRTFLNRRKLGEEELVKLLHLCEGRTRKESARLFYEILVLKTKGYVDVRQEDAYSDIHVVQVT